jgi:hypothetical protein
MHFRAVIIVRDELTHIPAMVGDWEVPIIMAKHGEEKVIVGELKEFKRRQWPTDVRSELQRLSKAYGTTGSGDNAPSFAEAVYGSGMRGVQALDAAIKAAQATANPKKAKADKKGADDLVGASA